MPRLSEVWALAAVDASGLIAVLAVLLAALFLGRLLLGSLANLPLHSRIERVLIWVLAGIVAFSWIGVLLAALRLFFWWSVLATFLAAVLVARYLRPRAQGRASPSSLPQTPRLAVAAILGLLAIALWLFARPAESFFLIDDSAVYTLGGIVLARDGRLLAQASPAIPVTPDFAHTFFVRNLSGTISRFYGPFYQYFLGAKELEIGFLPLPKVWSALMVWILGPARATWATPLFGVVSLAALYGLVRRALGWQAALISAFLLLVSLPQIWFARYPISEMYAQATVFGSLYLASVARAATPDKDLARRLAFWSAASLALWSAIRLEAVILLPLFAVFLVAGWGRAGWNEGGISRVWLRVLALFSSLGLAIAVIVSRHYVFDQSLGLINSRTGGYAVALLLICALVAFTMSVRIRHLLFAKADQASRWMWIAVGLVWAGWGILCLLLLVRGRFADSVPDWLTYYLSFLGLALALGGIGYLVWSHLRPSGTDRDATESAGQVAPEEVRQPAVSSHPELMTLLLIAGLLLFAYSLNPLVSRWQPWAVRRLVPLILPALAIAAGALLAAPLALLARPARRRLIRLASVAAVVLLLAQIALQAWPAQRILFHRELHGFAAQLQAIAQALPEDALLLFDNGSTGVGLPQVFDLWFGRPSLALREAPAGDAETTVDELIEKARAQSRKVFFVATDGDLEWFPERWDFLESDAGRIETTVLRPPRGRSPRSEDIVSRSYNMDFYEVLPHSSSAAPAKLEVPAAEGSYPYLRGGFYGWDLGAEGAIARWTDGRGEIALPWPAVDPALPVDVCLRLSVAGGRSGDAAPVTLTVQVEGKTVGEKALPKDFAPQQLNILARQVHNTGLDDLELALVSATWDSPTPGDNRDLGVLFYKLQMLPAQDCPQ